MGTGAPAVVSGDGLSTLPSLARSSGGGRETSPVRGGGSSDDAVAAALAAAAATALAAAAADRSPGAPPGSAGIATPGGAAGAGAAGAGAAGAGAAGARDGDGEGGGVGHGKRVISERPNWMKNAVVPRTPHEIALAVDCTSKARATCDNWKRVLIKAAFAYNCKVSGQFVAHGSRGAPGSEASKDYLAPTTAELLGDFWIRATKSNSNEQLRQTALAWGVGGEGVDAPVPRGGGPRSKAAAAGSAGPGEVLVMTDEEIERLGRNRLRETLRSLDGVGVSNKIKAPELARRLKDAVKAGKRRKLNPE